VTLERRQLVVVGPAFGEPGERRPQARALHARVDAAAV
jgi:hypothetical protein